MADYIILEAKFQGTILLLFNGSVLLQIIKRVVTQEVSRYPFKGSMYPLVQWVE